MPRHHSTPRHGKEGPQGTGRRRFLGYLLAAPTLVAAAEVGQAALAPDRAAAAGLPSLPQPSELYDLNDMLTDAALPTSGLITVTVHDDGTASFALPRAEVGQGITTSTAMLIAEELGPAAGARCTSPWPTPGPSCSSTSSPAAPTPPSPPTPRSGSPPRSPGTACCWPPPRDWANRSPH